MKILVTLLMLALAGPFEFDKMVHDFGEISIKDGPQTCEFVLTNVSGEPATINAVVSSCGCTKPTWTRTVIEPGKTGKVELVYSNDEGPSVFNKTVTVYVSGQKKPYVLHLRGKVTNKKSSE